MSVNLLLASNLVFPRHLFNMGPASMFSRGAEALRIDGYLTLILLRQVNLAVYYCLMKYVDPIAMNRAHPTLDTHSYKCAAGLKTLFSGISLDRKLTPDGRSNEPNDQGRCQGNEWRHAPSDRPVLGKAVGPPRSSQRTGGRCDLRLRTRSNLCFSGSLGNGIRTLDSLCELDQYPGRDGTEH